MTGQAGEALEQAVGLLRAPALRSALRRRPLPGGVGEVLAIASASSEAMRDASARTGVPEPELLEASRFYVQQVLLADGADAYRNLGATPDADHAVLRDHHRLLLRWLHPDRSSDGAQWDSALSTRVNQAWNQLRTPGVRARYDAERPAALPAADAGGMGDGSMPAAIPMPVGFKPVHAPEPLPTGPIAVAFLAIACLALAWLAWTREDRIDDPREARRFQPAHVDVAERMAAPLPRLLPEVDVLAPAPVEMVATSAAAESARGAAPDASGPEDDVERAGVDIVDGSPTRAAASSASGRTVTASAGSPVDVQRGEPGVEASSVATPRAADPLQLFHEAEASVESVTRWFAASGGHEPLWLDPQAAGEGQHARAGLRARQGRDARGRIAVDQPNWTLGTGTASMSAPYQLQGRRGTLETGVLHVRLARRDDQWRVAGVQLEPAR